MADTGATSGASPAYAWDSTDLLPISREVARESLRFASVPVQQRPYLYDLIAVRCDDQIKPLLRALVAQAKQTASDLYRNDWWDMLCPEAEAALLAHMEDKDGGNDE